MTFPLSISIASSSVCLAETRTTDLAPEYREAVASGSLPWAIIGVIVLVAVAAFVGYWLVRRLRVPVLSIDDDLTLELCRAHGIGLQYRVALDHVARLAGISHTAELFLSPTLFDQAIRRANEKKRLKRGHLESVHIARRLLFGELA